jgi:uroporphyrin-III C-methyltransferase
MTPPPSSPLPSILPSTSEPAPPSSPATNDTQAAEAMQAVHAAQAMQAPEAPPPSLPPAKRPAAGLWLAGLALLLALGALVLAWQSHERGRQLERELMRRQQLIDTTAAQGHLMAEKAETAARDALARAALLEARITEVAAQRGQLDELVHALSRSRDENVVGDLDAAVRVAYRQALITGSAEPLVSALKQADERLQRYAQPRLDGVRRAIARDLDKVQAVGVPDLGVLTLRLDEVVRMVDDLPLLSAAQRPLAGSSGAALPSTAPSVSTQGVAAPPVGSASAPDAAGRLAAVAAALQQAWQQWGDSAWNEVRSLVRVQRIDTPATALLAPEQRYFLRENVKLRLLHARLALMSRQFDTARADVRAALAELERHFDRQGRKTQSALELLQLVVQQSREVGLPRPDDTLTALAGAAR